MKYVVYAFTVLLRTSIGNCILFWLFAPFNTVGVSQFLPDRNLTTFSVVIVTMVLLNIWRRIGQQPSVKESLPLGKKAFRISRHIALIMCLVTVARFVGPLISHRLPLVGVKLGPTAALVCLVLMIVSCSILEMQKLLIKNLIATADQVLDIDNRKPVLYFRSFEKELSASSTRVNTLKSLNFFSRLFSQLVFSKTHMPDFSDMPGLYLVATPTKSKSIGALTHGRNVRKTRSILGIPRHRWDEQIVFARALSILGPYIALGRSNENTSNMDLGAAKKFVSNEEWRDTVNIWLQKSVAVVLEAADSASLGWEIQQTISLLPPTAVLIICPQTDSDYESFKKAHGHLFPKGLPEVRPPGRLLIFNELWQPTALNNVDNDATRTLQPFFDQVLSPSS